MKIPRHLNKKIRHLVEKLKIFLPSIAIIILIILIIKDTNSPENLDTQPSKNQAPSIITPQTIKLSTAWEKTKIFSNNKIDIKFKYPALLNVREFDNNIDKDSFAAMLSTSESGFLGNCDNEMYVFIKKQNNPKKLNLYEFITNINKDPLTNPKKDSSEFKKSLSKREIPKQGSYIFDGINNQNPQKSFKIKIVYFSHKEKVYSLALTGNCGSNKDYPKEASNIFDKMLKSTELL